MHEDPHGNTHSNNTNQATYHPAGANIPNYGFTDSVYFVHLPVGNDLPSQTMFVQVQYPLLDLIDLYACDTGSPNDLSGRGTPLSLPALRKTAATQREPATKTASSKLQCPSGRLQVFRTGDRLPFGFRQIASRTFLFPVNFPEGYSDLLLRFESSGTQEFPIRLLSTDLLRRLESEENLALGLYYGILLVLLVYNAVLLLIIRDPSYLFYLLYISGYGAIQLILNGLAFQYFWPDSPVWGNLSLPALIGWTFLWATFFSRSFLGTATFTPVLDLVLRGLIFAFLILLGCAFIVPYSWVINASAALVIAFSIAVVAAAVRVLLVGFRPARYFLLAWVSLLFGVTIFAMKGLGWLPATFATEYGLQIGSALEMGMLSLGLADRINVLQNERQESQRQARALEASRRTAELQAARLEIELLKKNVEPHFLLNSLNAVMIWLEEDPKNAARLLEALADELRLLLAVSAKPSITMAEELELCRLHLEVMSLRHDKKFVLQTFDLFNEELVPPLVFHTIIENGLSHGFRGKELGRFWIKRVAGESGLTFEIGNNGTSASNESAGSGIGLRYVRTRLEESYPNRWQLESGPHPEGWLTKITIATER